MTQALRTHWAHQHHDEHYRLAWAEALPVPHLLPWVERYSAYDEESFSFQKRDELATTHGVLLFNLGDPLHIVDATGSELHIDQGQGFVGGMSASTSTVTSKGSQRGIHVHLSLETMGRLFGVPLRELADRVLTLEELAGPRARTLALRMAEQTDLEPQFVLLDQFLAKLLSRTEPPAPELSLVRRTLRARPTLQIDEVARSVGWSRRHLARRFASEVGMTPKAFGRLARFEHFVQSLASAGKDGLADLAIEAGYFDQPHLNREVQSFAATTPGELLRRTLPENGGFASFES